MRRAAAIFVILVVGLSAALYLKLREQRLAASAPTGGSATIEGVEVAVVSRLASRIGEIKVEEGEVVKAGDLLVALDCREADAMLAQAEAALAGAGLGNRAAAVALELAREGVSTANRQRRAAKAQASATRAQQKAVELKLGAARRSSDRVAKVHSSGAASEQLLDRVHTEVAGLDQQLVALTANSDAAHAQADAVAGTVTVAQKQVALAQVKAEGVAAELKAAQAMRDRAAVGVSECTLTAPRDGYVQTRSFEPGEAVMPGSRILTLVDTREVEAKFYVPNSELAEARVSRPVTVRADAYRETEFRGTIVRVAHSAEFTPRNVQTREDRDRLVYAVVVRIPNPDGRLRPGMPVEIEVADAAQSQ